MIFHTKYLLVTKQIKLHEKTIYFYNNFVYCN
jgi:hypothetical protein